jgi:DEP domain-containing protein 5
MQMWEFDEDGEMFVSKCVHGFLPELFSKWKLTGTNHVVSIILFARIIYTDKLNEIPLQTSLQFHKDAYGRYCRDFYRVVVDWETRVDWSQMAVPLKHEFIRFQQDVLQQLDSSGEKVLSGSNTPAPEGNILEAVNLALNPFDKHYVDRDLSRTGLSIVIVTPGTGIFEGCIH